MPTDPNMTGLVYPDEDSSSDIWDTILNSTVFPVIGAHTHTTGDGVPIVSAALRINADVPWSSSGSNYSITDLKAAAFTPKAASAVSALTSALFVDSSTNDLYFRNASGTNVQITDGSTLNVSIVGGIGGDYSSVSALLDYDDATDTYLAKQEESASVRQYGKMAHADLKLFEYLAAGNPTVPINAVTIKSPASLAAGYSVTLPDAVPASTTTLKMNSSGNVSTAGISRTISPSIASYQSHTGDSGNARGSHSFVGVSTSGASSYWGIPVSNADESILRLFVPIPVTSGDVITAWTLYANKASDATNTLTVSLQKVGTDGTVSLVGAQQTNNANAPGAITFGQSGLSQTVAAGESYMLRIVASDTTPSAVDKIFTAAITATMPNG